MASEIVTTPSVSWAQKSSEVYLTFNVQCEKPDIKIDNKFVSFRGICSPDDKLYEVTIPLYAEINTEKSKHVNKGRYIDVVLAKEKMDESFWPALTNDKKKHHWLKVDFNKWQDAEDDAEVDSDDKNNSIYPYSSKNMLDHFGDEKEDGSSGEELDISDYP